MIPRLSWPDRNTKAIKVRIGGVTLLYSYETCVAASTRMDKAAA